MAGIFQIDHRLNPPYFTGQLLERRKRFLCDVRLDNGEEIVAHLADRGRLEGIMIPGARVTVSHQPAPHRKTSYSLFMVETRTDNSELINVCVDPAGANRLVEQLLQARLLRPWTGLRSWKREVRRGRSRFDFELIQANGTSCLIEVKSVVAAAGNKGLFPDAPSERARRHCLELAEFAQNGQDTAVILVAQRSDIRKIMPHPVDPDFKRAISRAKSCGVRIMGLSFTVNSDGFDYLGRIPVQGLETAIT